MQALLYAHSTLPIDYFEFNPTQRYSFSYTFTDGNIGSGKIIQHQFFMENKIGNRRWLVCIFRVSFLFHMPETTPFPLGTTSGRSGAIAFAHHTITPELQSTYQIQTAQICYTICAPFSVYRIVYIRYTWHMLSNTFRMGAINLGNPQRKLTATAKSRYKHLDFYKISVHSDY